MVIDSKQQLNDTFLLQVRVLLAESDRIYTERCIIDLKEYGRLGFSSEQIGNLDQTLLTNAKKCRETHERWREEIEKRINFAFQVQKPDFWTDKAVSINKWATCTGTVEKKSQLFLKLLAISIPEFGYDARMAFLMDQLWRTIRLDRHTFARKVESLLVEEINKGHLAAQQVLNVQESTNTTMKKRMIIGLSAVVGAIMVGATAGMAAPVALPLFGSLLGIGAGAAFMSGATGTALFVVLFGAGGAGLASYKMERRYRDITSFHFVPMVAKNQMRVAIGLSGWINEDKDITNPWTGLITLGRDVFALECEKEAFQNLGSALKRLAIGTAMTVAAKHAIINTTLQTAIAALAWPVAMLQATSFIDNSWSVCLNISKKAGLILADVIRNRAHGHRPLTLAGFSLGALMIFECLRELSKDPAPHLGIIENVVLFGLPAHFIPVHTWHCIRMLVAGRFIHCYSKNDWILRFLYRVTSLTVEDIVGLNALEGVASIENVDMTNFVHGHLEYAEKTNEMLQMLDL